MLVQKRKAYEGTFNLELSFLLNKQLVFTPGRKISNYFGLTGDSNLLSFHHFTVTNKVRPGINIGNEVRKNTISSTEPILYTLKIHYFLFKMS